MHDIFLSYSTQDRERLQPLFQALEQQGWSVFWDHRTIDIGDHWNKKIGRAIRTSKCVVVVWSKASVDSEWVLEEANIGKQRNVFLPIQIDEVEFPVGFTMRQAGNFIHWNGDVTDSEFIRLVGKIRELVEQHDAEQAKREAAENAEEERLAQEKAVAERQAREAAEQQRRLEEEARLRREAAEAAERERQAKEKAAAEQKIREEAERKRKQDEALTRPAEENTVKIKRLAQERAAKEKAREDADLEAKAKQEQERLAKEKALAEHEAASRQRWLDEAQSRFVAEEATNQEESQVEQEVPQQGADQQSESTKNTTPADDQKQDRPGKPLWKKLPFQLGMAVVAGTVLYQAEIARQVYINDSLFKSRYEVSDKGTVVDKKTNLMWKQCSEGQNGGNCSGKAATYEWDDAMSKFGSGVSFAGYSDWRMPKIEELHTLVYCSNGTPQATARDGGCGDNYYQSPTIDLKVFPNTSTWGYWSSKEKDASLAWPVDFSEGDDLWGYDTSSGCVRLVRSDQ